ncbi:MAG: glycosyltransferase family 4 protein [Candidatus Pacearchaeota archaeon]
MKILLISEYFPPKIFGGGEISSWLLAKNLSKQGIDVFILTSHFNEPKKYEEHEGVKIYRNLLTGKNPNSVIENFKRAVVFPFTTEKELIKLDKKENFDLIHCMNINSIIGAAKAKEKVRKPMIAHINSPQLFCPSGTLVRENKLCNETCSFLKFFKCFLRSGKISKVEKKFYLQYNPFFALYVYHRFKKRKKSLREMDFFIAVSNFMKNLLLREGIPEERIAVVPNMVELGKFSKLKVEQHDPARILYIGNYEKFKGPQILLEALREIKMDYRANFYGAGSLEKWMKNFVKENNLQEKIKICGEVTYEKIPQIYEENDIVVFPSLIGEAFGRVALEAMASGKIVIASKIGGVVDIIENGKDGFLIEPQSSELKNLLERLIVDKNLREKISKNARKFSTKYSERNVTTKMIRVYNVIMSK